MPQEYTLLPKLRTDRVTAEKRTPKTEFALIIVVTIARERYPVNLGRKLTLAEWDDKAKKAKGERAAVINAIIARKMAELTTTLEEASRKTKGRLTMADFRALLDVQPLQRLPIRDYFEQQMMADKAFQSKRKPTTLKRIPEAFYRIHRHMPPNVCFEDVKTEHLVAYFDAMLRSGAKNNTALKAMTVLRQVYNHAQERGVIKHYPFTGYKTPAYEKVAKPYLTLQQCDLLLNKLEAAEATDEPFTTLGFFLLECFSGLRQSDWNSWKIDKGEKGKLFLRLRMSQKTGEPVRLPLHSSPRLKRVVKWITQNYPDHKYPFTQQHANRILGKFMESVKLDAKIRTHSGRHTCATLLLDKGFSREAVAEVLGVTVKVVDTYAKLTRQKVQLEFERHGGL